MREFFKKYQKSFAGLVLAGVIFTSLLLPLKRAEAQFFGFGGAVPVNDILNNPKEYILDTLVYALIKVLLRTFTQGIVSWIRTGGFQGSSLLIDNFEEHFKRELNNEAGIFLEDIIGPAFVDLLCEPLRIAIPRFAVGLRTSFADRARCTISEIVDNLEDFHVDFVQGGSWRTWDALLQPNNNWMGVLLSTLDEEQRREAEAFLRTKTEVETTGGGLDPSKDCGTTSLGHIVNCVIKTPGKIVAKAAEDVFGSGVRQLELADEINEIIAAALDQLIAWAITGGGGGFSAGSVKPHDSEAPKVALTSPPNGARVSGVVSVSASASDNESVSRVQIFVDGRKMGESGGSFSISWDTTKETEGSHSLHAFAFDKAGNVGLSDIVAVIVDNIPDAGPPPPAP